MNIKQVKFRVLCSLLCILTVFSGCSSIELGFGGELTPPMLDQEQEGIYAALTSSVSGSSTIKLKYPRSGSLRSSFVLHDINGDGQDEAIVFYENKMNADDENTSSIRINVIGKNEEGEWQSFSDIGGVGTEIEQVFFLDIKASTKPFIFIGFSGTSDGNSIYRAYQWEGSSLNKLSDHNSCLAFQAMDLDADGEEEIVSIIQNVEVADISNESTTTVAQVLKYDQGEFTVVSEVELDKEVTSYTSILQQRYKENEMRIYIDGRKGTNLFNTQVLSYRNSELTSLTRNPDVLSKTERSSISTCIDINTDGQIDIPTSQLVPGYKPEDSTVLYYTNWYTFGEDDLEQEAFISTYVNTTDGYYFTLPENWLKEVSVVYDVQGHELIFFNYHEPKEKEASLNSGEEDPLAYRSKEVLRIRIVTKTEYEQNPSLYNEYKRLDSDRSGAQIYYLVKLYEKVDYKNAIGDLNVVKTYFSLIPN